MQACCGAILALAGGVLFLGAASPQASGLHELENGRKVYLAQCVSCHGEDGRGIIAESTVEPYPLDLTDPRYMDRMTDEFIFATLKYGQLAILYEDNPAGIEADIMVPFKDVLGDDEISAFVDFVNALRAGNKPSTEMDTMFQPYCAPCHGEKGRGDGPASRPLTPPVPDFLDDAYMGRFGDDYMFALIKDGKLGTAEAGYAAMAPFGGALSDEEIRAVIAYIRSLATRGNDNTGSAPK